MRQGGTAVENLLNRLDQLSKPSCVNRPNWQKQVNGAKVFAGLDTKIVAQQNHVEEMRKYRLMAGYNRKLNRVQWAASGPREERDATLGVDLLDPPESG